MKRNFSSLIPASLLVVLLLSSCEKTDKYIDWKVMNDTWYETHKNDSGFTVTESGLAYMRIGPAAMPTERKPNTNEKAIVKYSGTYINGYTFDSNNSTDLHLQSIIPGLREGLLKMRRGETYRFYIPQTIGYGDKKDIGVPPYSTLIFTVKLLDVKAY